MLVAYLIIKRSSPSGTDFFAGLGKHRPYFSTSQNHAKRFEKQIGYAYLRFLQSKGYGMLRAEFLLEDDNPPKVSNGSTIRSEENKSK
jgi:hypothetical protein